MDPWSTEFKQPIGGWRDARDADTAATVRRPRGDPARDAHPIHEIAPDIRQRTTQDRRLTAQDRLEAAARRDEIAHARDLAAIARDEAAAARDREMEGLEDAQAAAQRALAARDHEAAARDRAKAAQDRLHARADREALALALTISETDPLTHARTRAAGLADLDREVERCKRTNVGLVVAYVDVVGLKAINDTRGHGAGDALLRRAVTTIREHLRPYDLIVRLGGDEFLCAMPDMSLPDARGRFHAIAAALTGADDAAAIRTGFAALEPGEPAATLIERADGDLIEHARR